MTQDLTARIRRSVEDLVALLVKGCYADIERLSKAHRLSASEMRDAVKQYGRTLISPPSEAFNSLDIIRVAGSSPAKYSIRFNLWTVEEGCSDLSLEITLIEDGKGAFGVEIDDLHVL